jgi:hypothetical protein
MTAPPSSRVAISVVLVWVARAAASASDWVVEGQSPAARLWRLVLCVPAARAEAAARASAPRQPFAPAPSSVAAR